MVKLNLGEKIRLARKQKEMTQAELGNLLGVSEDAISAYERNKNKIPYDLIIKLHEILGIRLLDLLGITTSNYQERNDINMDKKEKKLSPVLENLQKEAKTDKMGEKLCSIIPDDLLCKTCIESVWIIFNEKISKCRVEDGLPMGEIVDDIPAYKIKGMCPKLIGDIYEGRVDMFEGKEGEDWSNAEYEENEDVYKGIDKKVTIEKKVKDCSLYRPRL